MQFPFKIHFQHAYEKLDSTGQCVWKLMLPPTSADAKTSYTITVSSDKYGEASISDVMFGDVWICSGQSNMHFAVSQVLQTTMSSIYNNEGSYISK